MANYQIDIHVDVDSYGNANFSYSPALQRVYPSDGDTVSWTCSQGPFAVVFREGTPCDDMSAQGIDTGVQTSAHGNDSGLHAGAQRHDSGLQAWASKPLTTRADARGAFHYCVAVSVDGAVYIDASCPVLVAN